MGSTVGQFCIAVNDLEESVRFYTEIMGLVEHGRTEIPNVNEVHLAGAEGEHGGRLQLAKFNPTMTPQPIDHVERFGRSTSTSTTPSPHGKRPLPLGTSRT